MTAIRQKNVTAAQWSANGNDVAPADLTKEENVVFGSNVFSIKTQKERLPADVFERLQGTLEKGEALDVELADAVAEAMKDWALENGATHYTHVFQPLTIRGHTIRNRIFSTGHDTKMPENFAVSDAMRMSQASASSVPPPRAIPFTAPGMPRRRTVFSAASGKARRGRGVCIMMNGNIAGFWRAAR